MNLPDAKSYLHSCRQWIPPRDRYPIEAWYVPKEDVIKMVCQIQRDVLEAVAKMAEGHPHNCHYLAQRIRAWMPEEKP